MNTDGESGSRAEDAAPQALGDDHDAGRERSPAAGAGPFAQAPGAPAKGPGPVSPAVMLSDRAGEESFENHPISAPNDPLANVLRMLDSITTPDSTVDAPGADTLEKASGNTLSDQAPAEPDTDAETAAPGPTGVEGPSGTDGAPRTEDPTDTERPGGTPPAATADTETAAPAAGSPSSAAQTRREAILDAAARLFAERGYHDSSLRDISREADISHPGMLHHFASKDALLGSVVDRMEDHAQGLLDSVERIGTSEAALDAALGGPWNPKNHLMGLLATLSSEVVNPKHPGRYRIARLRLVHEHVLEEVLQAFDARGDLAEDADPAFVARSTFSLLLSLAVRERSVRALQRIENAEPVADVHAFVRHYIVG